MYANGILAYGSTVLYHYGRSLFGCAERNQITNDIQLPQANRRLLRATSPVATLGRKGTPNLYHTGKALSSGLTDNSHHAILAQCRGGVAQLGERDNRTVEVRSSSLLTSTTTTQKVGPNGRLGL